MGTMGTGEGKSYADRFINHNVLSLPAVHG